MFQSFKISRKAILTIDSPRANEHSQFATFHSERTINTNSLYQRLKPKPIQDFVLPKNNFITPSKKPSLRCRNSMVFSLQNMLEESKIRRQRHNEKRVSFSDKILIIQPKQGVIIRERINIPPLLPEEEEQVNIIRTNKRKNCILIHHHRSSTFKTCQSTFIDQL